MDVTAIRRRLRREASAIEVDGVWFVRGRAPQRVHSGFADIDGSGAPAGVGVVVLMDDGPPVYVPASGNIRGVRLSWSLVSRQWYADRAAGVGADDVDILRLVDRRRPVGDVHAIGASARRLALDPVSGLPSVFGHGYLRDRANELRGETPAQKAHDRERRVRRTVNRSIGELRDMGYVK